MGQTRKRPSGGWDRLMVPGHCLCEPPRHTGNAGFMVGILLALQVDNWNEERKERRDELELLEALKTDLVLTRNEMDTIVTYNQKYLEG